MVKIILRIRTNLSVKRLSIDNSVSVAQVIEEVTRLFNIITTFPLVLALDLEGNRTLNRDELLPLYNISNGDEIFVLGRFENKRIDKTTINDQHEVIKAGDFFELVEQPSIQQHTATANSAGLDRKLATESKEEESKTSSSASNPVPVSTTAPSSTPIPTSQPAASSNVNTNSPSSRPPVRSQPQVVYDSDDSDEFVRPADEAQRMVLLSEEVGGMHHGPVTRLSEEVRFIF